MGRSVHYCFRILISRNKIKRLIIVISILRACSFSSYEALHWIVLRSYIVDQHLRVGNMIA
jgi:hypothetical protein